MPNMNLIDEYIRYLRLELNYSELTVKAYQTDLMGWADFATSGKPAQSGVKSRPCALSSASSCVATDSAPTPHPPSAS